MEVLFCYVIIYLVEAFILWLYCNDLFIPKYTVRQTVLCLSALYSMLFCLSMLNIYALNAAAFLLTTFIFIYFLYNSKWFVALFHAGITTTAMGLGELLSLSLFPDFIKNFYEIRSDSSLLFICTFFSKLIYFFIIYILSHLPITVKNKKTTGSRDTLALVPIPLATSIVMITLYVICFTADISVFLTKMITACSILLLVLNLLTWFFFSYSQKRNQDFIELQLRLLRENDTAEYYKMLSIQNENRNILIHNIRGHLYAIAAIAEQNHQPEILDYINNLIQTASLQTSASLQLCKNDTLNAILCRYKELCKEKDIDLRTDIRDGCIDFMSANDLTALFCNLLDNAVESAACIQDSFIELHIRRQENTPYIVLSVQNSCAKDPFDAHGQLLSHKRDRARHGLGMKSIRRTIENYEGDMQVYYDGDTGTFHAVVRMVGE